MSGRLLCVGVRIPEHERMSSSPCRSRMAFAKSLAIVLLLTSTSLATPLTSALPLSPESAAAPGDRPTGEPAIVSEPAVEPVLADPQGEAAALEAATPASQGDAPRDLVVVGPEDIPHLEEILELRTRDSKVFQVTEGARAVQASTQPIHYWDASTDAWADVNVTVLPHAMEPYSFANERNALRSYYPTALGSEGVRFGLGLSADTVEWIPEELRLVSASDGSPLVSLRASPAQPLAGGNTVRYPGLFPNASEAYQVVSYAVKSNLILESPPSLASGVEDAVLEYVVRVRTPTNYTLVADGAVRSGTFVTTAGFRLDAPDGSRSFTVGAPVAFDATYDGSGPSSGATPVDPTSPALMGEYRVESTPDGLLVAFRVPADWLFHPARRYPVTLDPWYTYYEAKWENWPNHKNAVVKDGVLIDNACVNACYENLRVNKDGGPFNREHRSFLGFCLSGCGKDGKIDALHPRTFAVTRADLYLYPREITKVWSSSFYGDSREDFQQFCVEHIQADEWRAWGSLDAVNWWNQPGKDEVGSQITCARVYANPEIAHAKRTEWGYQARNVGAVGEWLPIDVAAAVKNDFIGVAENKAGTKKDGYLTLRLAAGDGVGHAGKTEFGRRSVWGTDYTPYLWLQYEYDIDPPETRLTVNGHDLRSWYPTGPVDVRLECLDGGSGCSQTLWRLDVPPWDFVTPFRTDAIARIEGDSLHYLEYRTWDKSSNLEWKSVRVGIDSVPPEVRWVSAPEGWQTADFDLRFTATDALSGLAGCSYRVFSRGTYWEETLGLTDCGSHHTERSQRMTVGPSGLCRNDGTGACFVGVWLQDAAGNTKEFRRYFDIDFSPPAVKIESPVPGAWAGRNGVKLLIRESDAGSGFTPDSCTYGVVSGGVVTRVDSTARTCGAQLDVGVGPSAPCHVEGPDQCTITLLAVDLVGRWRTGLRPTHETVVSRAFSVDFTPPVADWTQAPAEDAVQSADFVLGLNTTDAGGSALAACFFTVESYNGAAWRPTTGKVPTPCGNPGTTLTIEVGSGGDCRDKGYRTCAVRFIAEDRAGNSVTTTRYFSVDLPIPTEDAVQAMRAVREKAGSGTSAVWDGRGAYVFGGSGSCCPSYGNYAWTTRYNLIQRYDPATDTFRTMKATLPVAHAWGSAVWTGQHAFVLGGEETAVIARYDPATDTAVDTGARLPRPMSETSAVWTGQHAYIFAGVEKGFGYGATKGILRYDPTTNTVTRLAREFPCWMLGTSAVWDGQHAYIYGGKCDGVISNKIFKFDPAAGTLVELSEKLPVGRVYSTAVWSDRATYVFGGSGPDNSYFASHPAVLRHKPSRLVMDVLPANVPAEIAASSVWDGASAYVFKGGSSASGDGVWKFMPNAPKLVLSNASPASGPVTTEVLLRGYNFQTLTDLRLTCSDPTRSCEYAVSWRRASQDGPTGPTLSDFEAFFVVPEAAPKGAYRLHARGTFGTASWCCFEVTGAPIVTSLTPASGSVGTLVQVDGHNLAPPLRVFFGSVEVKEWASLGTNALSFSVPSTKPGGHCVEVRNSEGLGRTCAFTVTEPPASGTGAGSPTISALEPANGSIGQRILVTGTNLDRVTDLYFGDLPVLGWTRTGRGISFTVPAAESGPVAVRAVSREGQASATFEVRGALSPSIATVEPASAPPGARVVVTGLNLARATDVQLGGDRVLDWSRTATGGVALTIPEREPADVALVVVTPEGRASASFRIAAPLAPTPEPAPPAPSIAAVEPASGPPGTSVRVRGISLDRLTSVRLGETALAWITWSDTEFSFNVPGNAAPGNVSLTAANPGGEFSSTFQVTAAEASPTADRPFLAGMDFVSGPAGSRVTLAGVNLGALTQVRIGSAAAAWSADADGQNVTVGIPSLEPGRYVIEVVSANGETATLCCFDVTRPATPPVPDTGGRPAILGFTPEAGAAGSLVRLRVQNVGSGVEVWIGNVPVAPEALETDRLDFYVPAGVPEGRHAIRIAQSSVWASACCFLVEAVPSNGSGDDRVTVPSVTAVSPMSGPPGTEVRVEGLNLRGATGVLLGSARVDTMDVRVGVLSFSVPGGISAGRYDITVEKPGGTAQWCCFDVTALAPPADAARPDGAPGSPAVTGLDIESGSAGTFVVVRGTNFANVQDVLFNGTRVEWTRTDSGGLAFNVPQGVAAGRYAITIVNARGQDTWCCFTVTPAADAAAPPPAIRSFGPASGGVGTEVRLDGENLGRLVAVRIGGEGVAWTRNDAGTRVGFRVPALAPGRHPISVEGEGGVVVSVGEFQLVYDPPEAPVEVAAEAGPRARQITIRWEPPAETGISLGGYRIYREEPGTLAVLVADLGPGILSFTDSGVPSDATRSYRVSARNPAGEGALSELATARTFALPGAPSGTRAQAGPGAREISFAWEVPEETGRTPTTGYVVLRGFSPDRMLRIAYLSGGALEFRDARVPNGATRYYAVVATNVVGEGALSLEANATAFNVPSAPVNLTAVVGPRPGETTLAWSEPQSDGGTPTTLYRVYRGVGDGFPELYAIAGRDGVFIDRRTELGRQYEYQVTAVNLAGEGYFSSPAPALGTGISLLWAPEERPTWRNVTLLNETVPAGGGNVSTPPGGIPLVTVEGRPSRNPQIYEVRVTVTGRSPYTFLVPTRGDLNESFRVSVIETPNRTIDLPTARLDLSVTYRYDPAQATCVVVADHPCAARRPVGTDSGGWLAGPGAGATVVVQARLVAENTTISRSIEIPLVGQAGAARPEP